MSTTGGAGTGSGGVTATAARPLADAAGGATLFRDWLTRGLGEASSDDAGQETEHAFTDGVRAAPLFRAWTAEYGLDEAQPAAANLQALRRGAAGVVVTGQQPGFLGGPLLTLYKVATAVALAQARTADGRPTAPVFWLGDDDEDLAEALEPVGWSFARRGPVRADGRSIVRGRRAPLGAIGRTAASRWSAGAAAWLRAEACGDDLGRDLSLLWTRACDEDWTWSRLNAAAVARIFRDQGLIVVRGDDDRLHEAAAPLYARVLESRAELVAAVRARGEDLARRGWHAQLAPRSLSRHLFTVADGRRRPLEHGPLSGPAALLRPGAMLRSVVQDHLLEPAAVVVGPSEAAYLRQIDPLYGMLGVRRSPLAPRLFGWLRPADLAPGAIAAFGAAGGASEQRVEAWANEAAEAAAERLRAILDQGLRLPRERAESLAAGRARRWRRGVAAMLRDEARRQADAARPAEPGWVFPDGLRQERRLAAVAAAAVWGEGLVRAVTDAAAEHLERGRRGDWREFEFTVPAPAAAGD